MYEQPISKSEFLPSICTFSKQQRHLPEVVPIVGLVRHCSDLAPTIDLTMTCNSSSTTVGLSSDGRDAAKVASTLISQPALPHAFNLSSLETTCSHIRCVQPAGSDPERSSSLSSSLCMHQSILEQQSSSAMTDQGVGASSAMTDQGVGASSAMTDQGVGASSSSSDRAVANHGNQPAGSDPERYQQSSLDPTGG